MLRGDELRRHILFCAKDLFLDVGFERASMDLIAEKADTTKRTLYKHFENKQQLFLAVTDLVHELLGIKLGQPSDYSIDPIEAIVKYYAQFRKVLTWKPAVRMCRLGIAEAERFPRGSASIYEAIFGSMQEEVVNYLSDQLGLSVESSLSIALDLSGHVLHPVLFRALFGIEQVSDEWLEVSSENQSFDGDWLRKYLESYCIR